jgi:hypothetical protein
LGVVCWLLGDIQSQGRNSKSGLRWFEINNTCRYINAIECDETRTLLLMPKRK